MRYSFHPSAKIPVGRVAERLEYLTFPSIRQRVSEGQLNGTLHGVVACCERDPVGLALTRAGESGRSAEILSLFVRRDHRGRGLGRSLLVATERLLRQYGFERMQLAYRSDWPACPLIERQLRDLSWGEPVTKLMLGKFGLGELAPTWGQSPLRRASLPEDFRIEPWSGLSADELGTLAAETREDYAEELAPLEEPERIEPLNSLVLRHRRKPVGWLVTHRINPHTIQYTRLHIAPGYRRLGRGLPLIAEAIERQMAAGIPFGVFQVRSDNLPMRRLIQRRLHSHLMSWAESRCCTKSFITHQTFDTHSHTSSKLTEARVLVPPHPASAIRISNPASP